MTQKVITLVRVGDRWRLKTPSGFMLDAFFRGDRVQAMQWAVGFVSSWPNWIIKEYDNETPSRISEQTL